MNVLITGAGGYIGGILQQVLRKRPEIAGRRVEAVAVADRVFPHAPGHGVTQIEGELTGPGVLDKIAAFAPDVTFHLAGVPGGASEADYLAGRRTNLDASLALFEQLANARDREQPPVVVYASTIAVYGTSLPAIVKQDTPLRPPITYGAHKQICEILLADFSRRGKLDGRSLRLPGIVARRSSGPGLTSAFMSDILHALADGQSFTCPVGANATAWWMSAVRCAENLVHAAGMNVAGADIGRAWPMPVLRLSLEEIVESCAREFGADRKALVRYEPVAAVEAVYGRYPPLDDGPSRALGLRDDGTAQALVRRAVGREA
jgi:nucleoside-diphosphate-sugar epimerase